MDCFRQMKSIFVSEVAVIFELRFFYCYSEIPTFFYKEKWLEFAFINSILVDFHKIE